MYTRRHFGKIAFATLPAVSGLAKTSSKIHGVQIGVAGYSYNNLPRTGLLDVIIQSMVDSAIGECLLYAPSTEPVDLADKARPARGGGGGGFGAGRGGSGGAGRGGAGGAGRGGGGRGGSGGQGRGGGGRAPQSPEQAAAVEALHQWHLTVPLSYYTDIRKRFTGAGVEISSLDAALTATSSDEDINRVCDVAKTLGAHYVMCAVTRSLAKRIAPIADKHGTKVAFQGRPNINSTDPDAMAKPADFEEALGYSKNFGTSIDVGDATGGGWDVLKFIQDTHSRVFALNLKDRTKANVSMPWGQGDTHLKEILQLVRDKKYPIRCYIDCDFAVTEGSTRVADIKHCMEFAKAALA